MATVKKAPTRKSNAGKIAKTAKKTSKKTMKKPVGKAAAKGKPKPKTSARKAVTAKKAAGKPASGKAPARKAAKPAAKPADKASTKTSIKASTGKKAAPKAPKAAPAAGILSGPRPGEEAPDFKLLDDAGRTQSLGNFRGRKVVLYFYPKDFTGGCTQQACDFRDSLGRLADKDAVVLGVSADSVDSHKRFKEKQGINYLLLSDPEHQAIGSYGVWQEKSLYGRKFMGIVRTTVLIDETGKVAKVFPKVKVAGHVDEVLASL